MREYTDKDWLYMTANVSGTVARIRLSDLLASVNSPGMVPKVESKKIGAGARTLKVVNDQVYVALNTSKQIAIMNLDFSGVHYLAAPAFPVGLDVDGQSLAVTSQGRQGVGGHRVWVFDAKAYTPAAR